MKYIFFLLLLLFPSFLLQGGEKSLHPAKVSLLYRGIPGKVFSRIRPARDIRLTIREVKDRELALLEKGFPSPSSLTIFLLPQKALPARIPPGALLLPYALKGAVLVLHPSNPLRDIPRETARNILEGKAGSWEKIPGRTLSGRFTLYGPRELLPPLPPEGKEALLIPAESDRARQLLTLDPAGIGILPLTFWEEKDLPLLSVGKIPPTPENFITGKYPLAEKLYLYAPPVSGRAEKLLHRLKTLLLSRAFHIELLYGGVIPLPPGKKK